MKPTATNPSTTNRKPRLGMLLLGFVLSFFAGDRLLAMLRMPDTASNTKAPARMLAEFARLDPQPNVVFVGSSYTAFGINPDTVDISARARGANVHSVNLGFGGALSVISTRLCELWLQRHPAPRVICYEMSPGILNSRMPSLRFGVAQIGGPREAELLWRSSPKDRSTALLSQVLAGFYQWDDVRTIAACVREGAPLFRPKFAAGDRGWLVWTDGNTARNDIVAERMARRDAYWGTFEISDDAIDAVERMLALGQKYGVQVRFFEMPMSSAWAQFERDDVRRGYAAALNELRAGFGDAFVVWRFPDGLVSDEDFFDCDHLLPSGAEKCSHAMADDLVALLRDGGVNGQKTLASRN